jgi:hypothetical protein
LQGLRNLTQVRGRRFPEICAGGFFRRGNRFCGFRQIRKRFIQPPGGLLRFFFLRRQIHLGDLVGHDTGVRIAAGSSLLRQFLPCAGSVNNVIAPGGFSGRFKVIPGRRRCNTGKKQRRPAQ